MGKGDCSFGSKALLHTASAANVTENIKGRAHCRETQRRHTPAFLAERLIFKAEEVVPILCAARSHYDNVRVRWRHTHGVLTCTQPLHDEC
jgi:hypothetical protein